MISSFDAYGKLANSSCSHTAKAGRHPIQAEAERLIVEDVSRKLQLLASHQLLEIGCGPGNLLIPLSFRVNGAVGIDHPDVIAAAQKRFNDSQLSFMAGQFPNISLDRSFDRILAYSVLHYLNTFDEAINFIDVATSFLGQSGRILVGDLPNSDRKARFINSDVGKKIECDWRRRVEEAGKEPGDPFAVFAEASSIASFSDNELMQLVARYRSKGFHAYLLPQPPELPFGYTREDLLIERL